MANEAISLQDAAFRPFGLEVISVEAIYPSRAYPVFWICGKLVVAITTAIKLYPATAWMADSAHVGERVGGEVDV